VDEKHQRWPARLFRAAWWWKSTESRQPNSKWAERKQDLLLVSSFGFWAVLLGLVPVVTLHLLLAG